ncbi:MAG: hypothetical protein KDB22_05830 [Planctomycetales bacterium]|nr:hypothetical protein [Planctomycetales bacterium]
MNRTLLIGLSVLLSPLVADQATAQTACPPQGDWHQSFHYDYYRNKMWPMPFRSADTRSVLDYFEVQRNNGWRLNNTLGQSMYNSDGTLTDSGRAHIHWIVFRAPQNRRVVFVLEGTDQAETAKRVEATQLAISEFIPVGQLPPIYLTNQEAPGSSGTYQTAVHRALTTSVPNPRLSNSANSGGGTSGN